MAVEKDNQSFPASAISALGNTLRVAFRGSDVTVLVEIATGDDYLKLKLAEISDRTVSKVQLVNLPIELVAHVGDFVISCRDETYAAAVVPLGVETHAAVIKRPQTTTLTAFADVRVRLEGTSVAIIGTPSSELLGIIEKVELENGLPHPTLHGIWARTSPQVRKSYLFIDLTEANANSVIEYAKTGGFGSIVIYDSVWTSSHGSYPVDPKNFPDGDAGLKKISAAVHAAGLGLGMHNLDLVVDKTDTLVHPVPAQGFMMYPERRRILAEDIVAGDTFIPTTATTAGLLLKADKSRYHGRDLRIGDEIITYDDLKTTAPYGFTGCKRGAHGTVPASHKVGSAIENFSEFIGHYRPDPTSELYQRVSNAQGEALKKFGFDYMYPDGIGENLGSWPAEPVWYISNLIVASLYKQAPKDVLFAHDPVSDYSWHLFAQGNTRDFAQTGVIEYFNHTNLPGAAHGIDDLQPFEFGWLGFFASQADADATRPREVEYAWSKALAYGAAMSIETEKTALDGNGRTNEIFSIIKTWEELKLRDYFSNAVREQMKMSGREFRLDRDAGGNWRVRPITYSPAKYVAAINGRENVWSFDNPYNAQPFQVTIEVKSTLASYADQRNIVLLSPGPLHLNTTGAGPLGAPARQTPGMKYELSVAPFASPGGGGAMQVRASNDGASAAGWGSAEVVLSGTKDLHDHRALATWVQGDGSGTYLHFVLEDSSRYSVRDYYVKLDFTGWHYVSLPEWAKGEVFQFEFPYSNYWSLRNLDFAGIQRLYVFLTNVPRGGTVAASFGRLEALQEIRRTVINPAVTVDGQKIVFPARMETGSYLEYTGTGKARVFDQNGFTNAELSPGRKVPTLRMGQNEVSVSCDTGGDYGETMSVTVAAEGEALR